MDGFNLDVEDICIVPRYLIMYIYMSSMSTIPAGLAMIMILILLSRGERSRKGIRILILFLGLQQLCMKRHSTTLIRCGSRSSRSSFTLGEETRFSYLILLFSFSPFLLFCGYFYLDFSPMPSRLTLDPGAHPALWALAMPTSIPIFPLLHRIYELQLSCH